MCPYPSAPIDVVVVCGGRFGSWSYISDLQDLVVCPYPRAATDVEVCVFAGSDPGPTPMTCWTWWSCPETSCPSTRPPVNGP